jgi:putative membrane protein
MPKSSRFPLLLLAAALAVIAWSGIAPADRLTWWLEVMPALIALAILLPTFRRFRFTDLAYALIALHIVVLCVGGHYTYARVPLGEWVRDALELSRNHYDRLGHFAQGFVPAIVAREILFRLRVVVSRPWRAFLIICICLAISAAYELIEWASAVALGGGADAFLGTQGDPWDTQKDMALALVGSIAALATLVPWHDAQLRKLAGAPR